MIRRAEENRGAGVGLGMGAGCGPSRKAIGGQQASGPQKGKGKNIYHGLGTGRRPCKAWLEKGQILRARIPGTPQTFESAKMKEPYTSILGSSPGPCLAQIWTMAACGVSGGGPAVVLLTPEVEVGELVDIKGLISAMLKESVSPILGLSLAQKGATEACSDLGGSPAVVLLTPEVEEGEILDGEGLALCLVDGEGSGVAPVGVPLCELPQNPSASPGSSLIVSFDWARAKLRLWGQVFSYGLSSKGAREDSLAMVVNGSSPEKGKLEGEDSLMLFDLCKCSTKGEEDVEVIQPNQYGSS